VTTQDNDKTTTDERTVLAALDAVRRQAAQWRLPAVEGPIALAGLLKEVLRKANRPDYAEKIPCAHRKLNGNPVERPYAHTDGSALVGPWNAHCSGDHPHDDCSDGMRRRATLIPAAEQAPGHLVLDFDPEMGPQAEWAWQEHKLSAVLWAEARLLAGSVDDCDRIELPRGDVLALPRFGAVSLWGLPPAAVFHLGALLAEVRYVCRMEEQNNVWPEQTGPAHASTFTPFHLEGMEDLSGPWDVTCLEPFIEWGHDGYEGLAGEVPGIARIASRKHPERELFAGFDPGNRNWAHFLTHSADNARAGRQPFLAASPNNPS
jgi:hypothetical protein